MENHIRLLNFKTREIQNKLFFELNNSPIWAKKEIYFYKGDNRYIGISSNGINPIYNAGYVKHLVDISFDLNRDGVETEIISQNTIYNFLSIYNHGAYSYFRDDMKLNYSNQPNSWSFLIDLHKSIIFFGKTMDVDYVVNNDPHRDNLSYFTEFDRSQILRQFFLCL